MKNLIDALSKVEHIRREVERRVELKKLPAECQFAECLNIRQGFVKEIRVDNKPHTDVRIRETNGAHFGMTAKYRPLKQEATTRITREIFETLWPKTSSKQLKKRYKLTNGWIVDCIQGGRIVAEYEYSKERRVAMIPKTFEVLRDLGKE